MNLNATLPLRAPPEYGHATALILDDMVARHYRPRYRYPSTPAGWNG